MSSGGGGSTTTTQTQSGPPPQVMKAYEGLVGAASNVASQPLQQYTDPMVAGFTPQQQAGFQTIDNAQGIGFPYINAAAQQYGQATAPLWDNLPHYDTSGMPAQSQDYWNRGQLDQSQAQGYADQAAQIAQQAAGWNQNAANYRQTAGDYGTLAGQQAGQTPGYTNWGLNQAGQLAQFANITPAAAVPYQGFGIGAAGNMGGVASGLQGNAQPYQNSASRRINLPGYNTLPTYLSPYTKNVTDALSDLFNQQNAEQFQQIRGNAATQGAYGGDREAVAEAITARQQQLGEAPAFSQALQSGFAQAQNELNTQQQIQQQRQQAERQNAIAAGQLGLGAGTAAGQLYGQAGQLGLGAGQLGLGANQAAMSGLGQAGQLGLGAANANIANAGLYNQIGQLNLGAAQGALGSGQLALGQAGTNLQSGQLYSGLGAQQLGYGQAGFGQYNTQQAQQLAADQANRWLASQAGFGMASLGNQALSQALTGANAQIGAGALQQQLAQEQLNIPYQQFLQAQAYPYQQLSFLSPIVEGTGSLSGGKGSTTYPGPSALSQIGGLGAAATGLSGLFGSGGGGGLQGTSGGSSGGVFGDQTGSAFGGEDFGGGFSNKRGGRIGYGRGGTTPDVPGIGNGVPILDLSYIPTETDRPVGSSLGIGIGAGGSQTTSGGGGGGGGLLGGIGQAAGAVKTAVDVGSALGGVGDFLGGLFLLKDGGRAGFALGGDTADPTQVDPTQSDSTKLNASTRWSLPKVPKISIDELIPIKGNAGPAIKGKGPPDLQAMPQQMPGQPQDSGLKGIGDLGKSLKGTNLFASSDDSSSSDSADKGYAGGGVPLSAAINFGGGSPGQSMQVDELRRLPLERLYEMSVRFPQNTPQGQMVARVLNEKRMTPGEGTAPTGAPAQAAAPSGGMGMGGGYGAASTPAAGGMGGQPDYSGGTSHLAHGGEADAEPGFVTEDELDPHPIVDHSGDSVVIRYPSEGKTLDLGLPSIKHKNHYAAGGAAAYMRQHYAKGGGPGLVAEDAIQSTHVPLGDSFMSHNGVAMPLLPNASFGNTEGGNAITRTAGNQTLAPGGGLGNWYQPLPQITKFGTGPGGSTMYPSATAFTPGMASVINGLTKGKGTIPPEFGGSTAAPAAPAAQSQDDINNAIFQQFLGPFGVSDSGGNRRGGRIGYAEGGAPDVDMGQNPNWELQYNNFAGIRRVGAKPGQGGFTAYATPEEGIGAISGQLDRYAQGKVTGKPINTLGAMVRTWAPSNENQTDLLVNRAAQNTGFHPNQPLDIGDPSVKSKLIDAFIRNEQGNRNPVSMDLINRVSGITPPAAMAPAGSDGGQDGPMHRGGRAGYAEGGEMDDPSEAPPPREREPDDSGLTALARDQRQLDTPDLADVVKSRMARSVVRDPPPESREQVVAPKRPAGMRSPLTDSLSLDDLLDKYERTKPPGEGYADIPPPEDRPIPDHRELTASVPGIGSPATAPVPVARKDDDFGAGAYEMWQKPGSGFTDPLSGEVLHAPPGGEGLGDHMPDIGKALKSIYSPEQKLAMPEGPPMMTQPTNFVAKPAGIGATATAETPAGIGAAAGSAGTYSGYQGEPYRADDMLRLPKYLSSLDPTAAPAKPAAPPAPNVTRVTSPPKVVQSPEPAKEAAAPAAAVPSGAITPTKYDAVIGGQVWRNGAPIGPAAPKAATPAAAPTPPVTRVTSPPQVTGTAPTGGSTVEFGGAVPAVVHPAQGYYQGEAAKFTGGNPGNWVGVGDSLAVGYIRNAGLGGTAVTRKSMPGAANADAAGGRSPQEVLDAIRAHPERYQGKNILLSGGVSNDPSQVNLVPQQIKALQDAHAAKIRVLGVGNRAGYEGKDYFDLNQHNAQLEQYAKASATAPAPATGELERAYPNDPRQGQGAGSVPPPGQGSGSSRPGNGPVTPDLAKQAGYGKDPEGYAELANYLWKGEASDFNILYGNTRFTSGYDKHPADKGWLGGYGPAGPTHAAGLPQFQPKTWHIQAEKLGLNDFSPVNQVKGGLDLAETVYRNQTGGDLLTDFKAGKLDQINGALHSTWTSLGTGSVAAPPRDGAGAGSGGSGGGPRQPGPGEPEQVTAGKDGKPVVTAAGQPVVDAFRKDLTERTAPKDRNRLKEWMDSPSFILFMVGAGMLASRSPFPGVALGEGLLAAGKSAQEVRKDQSREDLAEQRINSMAGRVGDAREALAERTRHNTETEKASIQRITDAAEKAKLQHEVAIANQQRLLDASRAASERAGATVEEKRHQNEMQNEIARLKLDQTKPIPVTSQDENGNPITHLVPPATYADRSTWVTVGGGPKAAGMTEAQRETNIREATKDYITANPGKPYAEARAEIEKIYAKKPTFDPNKPATPYTGPPTP